MLRAKLKTDDDHHILVLPAQPPSKGKPWGTPTLYLKAAGSRRFGWRDDDAIQLGKKYWWEFTEHRYHACGLASKPAVLWSGRMQKDLGMQGKIDPPITIVLTFADKRPGEEESCR